jgi:hypothetical protein
MERGCKSIDVSASQSVQEGQVKCYSKLDQMVHRMLTSPWRVGRTFLGNLKKVERNYAGVAENPCAE